MAVSDDRSKNWLEEAMSDLETARVLLDAGRFSACVFHSQQASEKAMKALLLKLHQAAWGHSVWNLYLDASRALDSCDPAVERAARNLDFHYVSSRYPDAFPSGTAAEHYCREDAEEALTWAQTVLSFATKHL